MNIKQQYIVLYAQDGRTTLGFVKLTYQGEQAMVQAQANIRSDGDAELCLDDGSMIVRLPMQNRRSELTASGNVAIGTGRIVAAVCNSKGLQALGQSMMPKAYWHASESMCRANRSHPMVEEAVSVSDRRVVHEKQTQPKSKKEPMPVQPNVPMQEMKKQAPLMPNMPPNLEMPNMQPMPENPKAMPEMPNLKMPNMQPMPENPKAMPEMPNLKMPNMQPMPENPKAMPEMPNLELPNVQPMPEKPKAMPEMPKQEMPNIQPMPEKPKAMPEMPKQEMPNIQPMPEKPKAMPEMLKQEMPNIQPMPEKPKAMPEMPKQEMPNIQPMPENPKAMPEMLPNQQMEMPKTLEPEMCMPETEHLQDFYDQGMRMMPGNVRETRMWSSQVPSRDMNLDCMWETMPDSMRKYVRECVRECMRDSMHACVHECVHACMQEYMHGTMPEHIMQEKEPQYGVCPEPMMQMPDNACEMTREMSEEPEMYQMPEAMCDQEYGMEQMPQYGENENMMQDNMAYMPKHVPMLSSHSRLWSYLYDVCPSSDSDNMRRDGEEEMFQQGMDQTMDPQSFTSYSVSAMPMDMEPDEGDIRLSVMGPYANLWRWRRVVSREADYSYLMGEVIQDGKVVAVAVAVPGSYAPSPPANLQGFHAYRDGHWILAQNAETGDIIDI